MTREEAIKILEYRRCLICQTCHYFHTPFVCERCNERNCKGEKEALKMAIEALRAESTMSQLKVDVSINKPTERWDTCGLSENDILVDSGARGERHDT